MAVVLYGNVLDKTQPLTCTIITNVYPWLRINKTHLFYMGSFFKAVDWTQLNDASNATYNCSISIIKKTMER